MEENEKQGEPVARLDLQLLGFPADLSDQIESIGKKECRTRNGQLVWFLREAVRRYNEAPGNKRVQV